MAILPQESEGKRGLFGERTQSYPLDQNQGAEIITNQVFQLVKAQFSTYGGQLQYLDPFKEWKQIDLDTAKQLIQEHIEEPLKRNKSLETATMENLGADVTTYNSISRRLRGALWELDLHFNMHETVGDGNVVFDPRADWKTAWQGQPKGSDGIPPHLLRLRQLVA